MSGYYECRAPSSSEVIYISYKIGNSTYTTIEAYPTSWYYNGHYVMVYLPEAAKTTSVSLRWSQPSHSGYTNYDVWVLDDVKIGEVIETVLHSDYFTHVYNPSFWSTVQGGSVVTPPCGPTHSDNALYFNLDGIREAVTHPLDLREATGMRFYLQIGSSDSTCDNAESGEGVELSYRIGTKMRWILMQTFSPFGYGSAKNFYFTIDSSLLYNNVQFRFMQSVLGTSLYDTWSIDNFEILKSEGQVKCSVPCYSDNFESGVVNDSLWKSISGAIITVPPCSDVYYGRSLYFTGNRTREATTIGLDLRGLYAISFNLQIGSYDNECDQAEKGDDIILSYSLESSSWVMLHTFSAINSIYTRATTVVVPIPLFVRTQGVSLRWAQTQHSGSSQDTWFIDNVGVFSPNQCSSPPTTTTKMTMPLPTPLPAPSPTPSPETCKYYSDNFDTGEYKTSLWAAVTGLQVTLQPCGLPYLLHHALQFYGALTREAITHPLDLKGVDFISFYLISGHSSNGCRSPASTEGLSFDFKIGISGYTTIEYYNPSCCISGKSIKIYLPEAAKTTSVSLRWSQSHSGYTNYDVWVLDDIKIGEVIETVLYSDHFTNVYNPSFWSTVQGGSVVTPPCGPTHSDNALYFNMNGIREAVTHPLDLREATAMRFYLRIGSNGVCDNAESGEGVKLSFRIGVNMRWMLKHMFSPFGYLSTKVVYFPIDTSLLYSNVQFRFMQNVLGASPYDTWSIDNFEIIKSEGQVKCSVPCYSDNFESGVVNTSFWKETSGALIIVPPCSDVFHGKSLYFTGNTIREATTIGLDLRGTYAISFTLQIGSYDNECDQAETGDDVILYYSFVSSNWVKLKAFPATDHNFTSATTVTVPIPLIMRAQGVSLRWTQPQHSGSSQDTWFIDNVGVFSPGRCPPPTTTNLIVPPPTPLPAPSPTPPPETCKYYGDNFDTGEYKTSLWAAVTGLQVTLQPCGLPYLQHHALQFYGALTREAITHPLDLRGVDFISFYLISGHSSNGCRSPASTEGLSFDFKIGISGYTTIEYYNPSCCISGKSIKIYLPEAAKTTSVSLRWSQSHSGYTNYDVWVLDDIKIGEVIETVLYSDHFTHLYNPSFWSTVQGGSVVTPPCGPTHSDNALYFNMNGIREAVTHPLDLREATAMRFYLRIGSNAVCDNAERGEGVELSFRLRVTSRWTLMYTFSPFGYLSTKVVYFPIDTSLLYNNVQFRFMQSVLGTSPYDTWSIDNFEIIKSEGQVKCSIPCYSDNFESGVVNDSLWKSISGAIITVPPCSDVYYGRSLYFTGNGTREAVTIGLDLRGTYAISFSLQIGSYDNECDQAEAGDDVILYYSSVSSNWVKLQTFPVKGNKYTRATTAVVPIPLKIRTQGVSLRWAQIQHSGSSQDTWFIDNVGVYSPNQCTPSPTTASTIMPLSTPPPPPASMPPPESCHYYHDNFDTGEYKTSLWTTVTGVKVISQPCGLSYLLHYAMQFYAASKREVTSHPLDLRGVDSISFYLISGYSSNGCQTPSSTEGLSVGYKIGSSGYVMLEYYNPSCCINGKNIKMYLPEAAKTTSVSLRWSQSHSGSTNYDVWVLDDIKIGEVIETVLYSDYFTNLYNPSFWSTILGGSVVTPPCGPTHSDNALYFNMNGIREAVTRPLDLREATGMRFYLRIGSNGVCDNAESGEGVELSYRIGVNSRWILKYTFSPFGYHSSKNMYFPIDTSLLYSNVQFCFMQNVLGASPYDTWSIDNFEIIKSEGQVKCSVPCYSDNFESGVVNTSFWKEKSGALIIVPPCSDVFHGKSLYFTGNTIREATTIGLDLRGTYAISFILQIGSYDNECDQAETGDDVILYYSFVSSNWVKLKTFPATDHNFTSATTVTVPIPLIMRTQGVSLRWTQPQHSGSSQDTWFIDNVGVYSPGHCPPPTTTNLIVPPPTPLPAPSPTPLPAPSPTPPPETCKYYGDNFDTGEYKTSLWAAVTGLQVTLQPCGLPYLQHHALQFYGALTREAITHPLDLRGVDFISFYLISGHSSNGCRLPASTEGLSFDFKIGISGYTTIEYYNPSCCISGKSIKIYLPEAAKTTSVSLRWSQSHSGSTNYDMWVLDDIKIGEVIETVLYSDHFTHLYNPSFWSTVQGGSVVTPPCGPTHSDYALYFNMNGIREAVTHPLDLREATGMRFYLRIGSNGVCDNAESGEGVKLSYRIGVNSGWTLKHTFTPLGYHDAKNVYFSIDSSLSYNNVQFRFIQSVLGTSPYDTWSIDNFEIIKSESHVKCSVPCYSDNFESGVVNTSFWKETSGASIIVPPCSDVFHGKSLYFTGNTTREATTISLDLRGLYAISFTLQIGSYDNECDQAETGDDVVLYYFFKKWITLQIFPAKGNIYGRAITVVVPIPLIMRTQGVSLRWAQTHHSGLSQDTWFIDNVGVYSPDQCPPIMNTITPTQLPAPSPSPLPESCNYYSDNFDTGGYKNGLWAVATGAQIKLQPCDLPYVQHFAITFFGLSTREAITTPLDLREVDYINFYLRSGSYSSRYSRGNGCWKPASTEGIYVGYKIGNSGYTNIEYYNPSCCYNGRSITVYLPEAAKTSLVSLRWSQPTHSEYTNYDVWVLDDVKIGVRITTALYSDYFTDYYYNPSLWATIQGGNSTSPPCGPTHSGSSLYFYLGSTRQAVTHPLDLRDATGLNFYLRIGSSNNQCDKPESGDRVELSYRIGVNSNWTLISAFSALNFLNAEYVYLPISTSLQYSNVKFRFIQSALANLSKDVWSIDSFEIVSSEPQTKCSLSCYSDNFNSGVFDTTLWSSTMGASITVPPCNDVFYGRSLYFTGSGTREVITNALDLRGFYAVSFTLQIGSYDNECDQAETGDDVILYYSLTSYNWQILQTFTATSYTRATTVTVPIPRIVRTQGASLRWAQPQHSGSSQDTWFIDNVGIYSPDQCPPVAYQTATPSPSLRTCNFYSDNFDAGKYDVALWDYVTGITPSIQSCGLPSSNHYGMLFISSGKRQMVTKPLDLQGVESISFYLISGTSYNKCSQPSTSEGIYVQYRIGTTGSLTTLGYFAPSCCTTGTTLTIYLPAAAKANSVVLQWLQQSHTLSTNYDEWVLDNVKIGERFDIQLYSDMFVNVIDPSIWSGITGGNVTLPPCGVTDSDNAAYFNGDGIRELVSQSLDLSHAIELSFYLRIGSSDGTCQNPESGNDIEIAYKVGTESNWTIMAVYNSSNYRSTQYLFIDLPTAAKQSNVQLQFKQANISVEDADTWSIDTFAIKGALPGIHCAYACVVENFEGGYYNPQLWLRVQGGQVTILPCSFGSRGIRFDRSGTRELLSHQLDLTGIYAISFMLRIGSSLFDCTQYINGETIKLSYSLNHGINWNVLEIYTASSYVSSKEVVVLVPRVAQSPKVTLQWVQETSNSNMWSIDNVKFYSTKDSCPELPLTAATLFTTTILSTSTTTLSVTNTSTMQASSPSTHKTSTSLKAASSSFATVLTKMLSTASPTFSSVSSPIFSSNVDGSTVLSSSKASSTHLTTRTLSASQSNSIVNEMITSINPTTTTSSAASIILTQASHTTSKSMAVSGIATTSIIRSTQTTIPSTTSTQVISTTTKSVPSTSKLQTSSMLTSGVLISTSSSSSVAPSTTMDDSTVSHSNSTSIIHFPTNVLSTSQSVGISEMIPSINLSLTYSSTYSTTVTQAYITTLKSSIVTNKIAASTTSTLSTLPITTLEVFTLVGFASSTSTKVLSSASSVIPSITSTASLSTMDASTVETFSTHVSTSLVGASQSTSTISTSPTPTSSSIASTTIKQTLFTISGSSVLISASDTSSSSTRGTQATITTVVSSLTSTPAQPSMTSSATSTYKLQNFSLFTSGALISTEGFSSATSSVTKKQSSLVLSTSMSSTFTISTVNTSSFFTRLIISTPKPSIIQLSTLPISKSSLRTAHLETLVTTASVPIPTSMKASTVVVPTQMTPTSSPIPDDCFEMFDPLNNGKYRYAVHCYI